MKKISWEGLENDGFHKPYYWTSFIFWGAGLVWIGHFAPIHPLFPTSD